MLSLNADMQRLMDKQLVRNASAKNKRSQNDVLQKDEGYHACECLFERVYICSRLQERHVVGNLQVPEAALVAEGAEVVPVAPDLCSIWDDR